MSVVSELETLRCQDCGTSGPSLIYMMGSRPAWVTESLSQDTRKERGGTVLFSYTIFNLGYHNFLCIYKST